MIKNKDEERKWPNCDCNTLVDGARDIVCENKREEEGGMSNHLHSIKNILVLPTI